MNEVLPAEKALSLLEPIRRSVYYVCLTKQTVYMSVHGRYACVAKRDVAQQIVHKPEQSRIVFFLVCMKKKGKRVIRQSKTKQEQSCIASIKLGKRGEKKNSEIYKVLWRF